ELAEGGVEAGGEDEQAALECVGAGFACAGGFVHRIPKPVEHGFDLFLPSGRPPAEECRGGFVARQLDLRFSRSSSRSIMRTCSRREKPWAIQTVAFRSRR